MVSSGMTPGMKIENIINIDNIQYRIQSIEGLNPKEMKSLLMSLIFVQLEIKTSNYFPIN